MLQFLLMCSRNLRLELKNHLMILSCRHYNMNRIRLVWSRIWSVLSEFFVAVGLSENLSVAIFVMDSLRQLAMKFLDREELANYNFQNEFLRPFAVVMQKSCSTEIRELIVRCISQMVLSRVNNIKSGWKSVFMVIFPFTCSRLFACDLHNKQIYVNLLIKSPPLQSVSISLCHAYSELSFSCIEVNISTLQYYLMLE